MTYADFKTAVLKKIGEARNITLGTNETEQDNVVNDYIKCMPGLLSDALQRCATAGRYIVKSIAITQDGTDTDRVKRHDLSTLATDFYSLSDKEIYFDDGDTYQLADNYTMEGESLFTVPSATVGTWTVYYNSYPQVIAETITDETEISVAPEVYSLLVLYAAAELLVTYEDSNYAITRKQEFEGRLDELRGKIRDKTTITVIYDEELRYAL